MGNCRSSLLFVIPKKPNPQLMHQLWLSSQSRFQEITPTSQDDSWGGNSSLSIETNINAHVFLTASLLLLSKHSQVQQTSDWKLELVQLPVGDVYSIRLWYITARASVQSSRSPLGEGNKKNKGFKTNFCSISAIYCAANIEENMLLHSVAKVQF